MGVLDPSLQILVTAVIRQLGSVHSVTRQEIHKTNDTTEDDTDDVVTGEGQPGLSDHQHHHHHQLHLSHHPQHLNLSHKHQQQQQLQVQQLQPKVEKILRHQKQSHEWMS